jgi:hypothetical protein
MITLYVDASMYDRSGNFSSTALAAFDNPAASSAGTVAVADALAVVAAGGGSGELAAAVPDDAKGSAMPIPTT